MESQHKKRSAFSGKIGFVLSAAGASVGLGNIWRFPYLAAKYGGGIFLLIYILLAFTFGYTMIVAETALGRMTKKSPVGAFAAFGKKGGFSFGGWINAIIPILIVPYYSVIGGWVIRYLADYIGGHGKELATDGYFSSFISNGASAEICFVIFTIFTLAIIFAGVRNGVERVSKVMMPILVVLSVIIAGYSVTRPGALAGVKYFLVPNVAHFSWMTVVTAMGQMFYSLSIAMGILVTFGSYMKKDVSIEESTENVEIFDTAIAIMAGLMIIPAVFSFSGGDPDTLQAGPALMFITIPKVFDSMGLGTVVGILFFTLVLFAAVTSSIALTESAVSTFEDELGWDRHQATVLIGVIMLVLGSLSALGYGPLAGVTVFGMQFLDFFDFLTNSVMMPIAAITTCLLVSRVIGVKKIEEEVTPPQGRLQLYDPVSLPRFRGHHSGQLGGKCTGLDRHVKENTASYSKTPAGSFDSAGVLCYRFKKCRSALAALLFPIAEVGSIRDLGGVELAVLIFGSNSGADLHGVRVGGLRFGFALHFGFALRFGFALHFGFALGVSLCGLGGLLGVIFGVLGELDFLHMERGLVVEDLIQHNDGSAGDSNGSRRAQDTEQSFHSNLLKPTGYRPALASLFGRGVRKADGRI